MEKQKKIKEKPLIERSEEKLRLGLEDAKQSMQKLKRFLADLSRLSAEFQKSLKQYNDETAILKNE